MTGSSVRRESRERRRNPPEATPDASTEEACQQCSLDPAVPCDVDKLVLEVVDKNGKTKKLETTSAHQRLTRSDLADDEVRNMLFDTYDFVIDVLADVDASNWKTQNPAKVGGKAHYHGRNCSVQEHAALVLRPLGNAPELGGETERMMKEPGASMLTMEPLELWAERNPIIEGSASSGSGGALDAVTDIIGMITLLWDVRRPRLVELNALSCGARAKEDTKAANLSLRGAARIFRDSKLSVGIKIPALGTFDRSREGTRARDRDGLMVNTGRTVSAEGVAEHLLRTDDSSGTPLTAGYLHQTEQGDVTRTVTRLGAIGDDDVKARLQQASGFAVIIKHNEVEVDPAGVIKKIEDDINAIVNTIKDLQNLVNASPQLGWKFMLSVSVFAGTITLDWFPEDRAGALAQGRYLAVEWKLQGNLEIELFNITASISFGIDARAAGSGLVLNATGSIFAKAKISTDIALDLFKPHREIGIEPEAGASLDLVGEVTVFGKTLAAAALKGEAGIELKNGKLHLKWDEPSAKLEGTLQTKPVKVSGYIRSIIWFDKYFEEIVAEEQTLYAFG